MSLNDLLERMHCCGQMGTLNVDDDEDLATAKQAILTDLLEIIATTTKGYPELDYLQKEIWKDAQMKLRAELRDKVRKYCE